MKRIFKTGILGLALLAGTTGVFATSLIKPAEEATYVWSGSGPLGEGITFGDIPHAEDYYGCSGGGAICATGVNQANPSDVQFVRFN